MSELTWKYIKPLRDRRIVDDFLKMHGITLPSTLIDCIKNNNGGRPSMKLFDTDKGKGYVFKCLLSYNKNDTESIYKVYPGIFEGTSLYPIGSDASGNFVCFDINVHDYVLLKHETNIKETIDYCV